ncbi:MAG: DUF4375 domain-containing protein [Pyrinomonadaceae bacterium]
MGSSTLDKDIAASFEAFANRKIYTRLDPSTLSSIADADVELAIIDYVSYKLDGHYHEEVNLVGALPTGIRATYLTWIVEAEVHNGGFNQYYFNTDGKFASEAVEAFAYFGAPEHAALMREANAVRASEEVEMAKFKKQGSPQAFSESYEHTKLGPLDDRFYKLMENLSQLRVARIRQMPEQFSGE